MTTSVPIVVTDQKIRESLARVMELGFEAARLSGDVSYLRLALGPVKDYYEQVLKIAFNEGRLDRSVLDEYRLAIEKVESIIGKSE